jgi:putative hydrolase of the HAD superfamily
MAMPVPSLVLFDLDETLYDHRHASRTGLGMLQSRYPGLARMTLDALEALAFETLERVHQRLLRGEVTRDEARLERLRAVFRHAGEAHDDVAMDRVATAYGEAYRSAQRAVPGAVALLGRLRETSGVECLGIVTNHFAEVQEPKLEACGLTGLLDFMVTSAEVGHLKPAPQVFHAALERGGCRAQDAVMVGDSWEGDIVGAQAAGIRPVWFNRRGRTPGAPPRTGTPVSELAAFEPIEDACRVILSP